jgi:hypothetical protein
MGWLNLDNSETTVRIYLCAASSYVYSQEPFGIVIEYPLEIPVVFA